MGMVNRAKGNFGSKENGDLKVTLDFGDQKVIIDANKSNFNEQKLTVSC